jgi:SAM-dependent methyltransferase
MDRNTLIKNIKKPVSRFEIVARYCRGKEVLDIGCVNHNTNNTSKDHWLHQQIKSVASICVGVDYLEREVEDLKSRGYNVICADVTHSINLARKFDVIIIGNLIEHLSSFDGLFLNINRLLKDDGCVLISTANPFYSEQYFYSAFKNDIIINPEHTCWIDPVALEQLIQRYKLITQSVYWIKEKWPLSGIICNGEKKSFNILTGVWTSNSTTSFLEKILRPLLLVVFRLVFPNKAKKVLVRCGSTDKVKELLYIRFVGFCFSIFWFIYSLFIIKSRINSYELYIAVIKRRENEDRDLI